MARSDKYSPVGLSSVLSEYCFVCPVVVILDDELFDLHVKSFPVNPLFVMLPLSVVSFSDATRLKEFSIIQRRL